MPAICRASQRKSRQKTADLPPAKSPYLISCTVSHLGPKRCLEEIRQTITDPNKWKGADKLKNADLSTQVKLAKAALKRLCGESEDSNYCQRLNHPKYCVKKLKQLKQNFGPACSKMFSRKHPCTRKKPAFKRGYQSALKRPAKAINIKSNNSNW